MLGFEELIVPPLWCGATPAIHCRLFVACHGRSTAAVPSPGSTTVQVCRELWRGGLLQEQAEA